MELKGRNVKRISKIKKEKMRKTLKIMTETREKDNINLRDLIKVKLNWALDEKQKGLNQLEKLKIQIYKLEGIVLGMKDLLEPKKEEKKS